MAKIGVFIGRFQPFHEGHLHIIKQTLAVCDHLLIVIGSIKRPRTIKNPFSYEERKQLIEANLAAWGIKQVSISGVEDQMYNEPVWIDSVKQAVAQFSQKHDQISIVGHDKDASTYYLKCFPQWGRIEFENFKQFSATLMRADYYEGYQVDQIPGLTEVSRAFLNEFKASPHFALLQAEYTYIRDYKKSWKVAPYPPMFVTTDSVVICQNHILLVQRKNSPGKFCWALPGGYVEQEEWIKQGLVRELVEETAIEVAQDDLLQAIKQVRVFDHPDRALIGRVITHAGLFELPNSSLPKIKAADDALNAKWVPLAEFWSMQDQMHDDHYFIAKYLL